MHNFNDARYPTVDDIVDAVNSQGKWFWPEFNIASVYGLGETITKFQIKLRHRDDPLRVIRIGVEVLPNQNGKGYHIMSPNLIFAGTIPSDKDEADELRGHGPEFEALRALFPKSRIRFIDNEGDDYSIFGFAAFDEAETAIIGFVQLTPEDLEEEYWKNDDLPYGQVVIEPHIIARINEDSLEWVLANDTLDRY